MDHATFAAEGSPRELIEHYCSPEVLELRFDPELHDLAADKLKDFPAERAEVLADRILLYVTDGDAALAAVRASAGLEPLTSLVRRGTLEDVFLRLSWAEASRTRDASGNPARQGSYEPGRPRLAGQLAIPFAVRARVRLLADGIPADLAVQHLVSLIGPLFYLGAMGLGLGGLVDRHGTASLGGVTYLAFVAPAILATGAMNTAMGEAGCPVLSSVEWNRDSYVAARASPLRPGDIFRGHLRCMTMRIAINAALVTVYMWALGATRSAWVVLAWPSARRLQGLRPSAAPIAAWAVTVKSENNFAYLFRFGMMPLMLFSGTFFPISQLPGWLRLLAYATPLWHGVDLCRMLHAGPCRPDPRSHRRCRLPGRSRGHWRLQGRGRLYRRRLYVLGG